MALGCAPRRLHIYGKCYGCLRGGIQNIPDWRTAHVHSASCNLAHWLTRHGSPTIYRCFALPQLLYRWRHQSGIFLILPRIITELWLWSVQSLFCAENVGTILLDSAANLVPDCMAWYSSTGIYIFAFVGTLNLEIALIIIIDVSD
jgi:hypothetical protein